MGAASYAFSETPKESLHLKNEHTTIDENNIAHSSFITYSYETDCFSQARLAFYFEIVQEAGGNHAAIRKCSIADLQAEEKTWVITRSKIHVDRYTQWPEQIEVETWAQDPIRLHLPRVVQAFDKDHTPVFQAKTYWAILDLESGRPCRPGDMAQRIALPPEIRKKDMMLSRRSTYEESGCITLVSYKPKIQYLDTDRNLHVNNISYLNWALESLPTEFRNRAKISDADVSWIRQTFGGDELIVYTGSLDAEALFCDTPVLYHKIERKETDGKLTIVWEGTTTWMHRESFI